MAKPIGSVTIWANDAIYPAGGDGWSSAATKVANPAAGTTGVVPETPIQATYMNHELNQLSVWAEWVSAGSLAQDLDAHIVETDVDGTIRSASIRAGATASSSIPGEFFQNSGAGATEVVTMSGGGAQIVNILNIDGAASGGQAVNALFITPPTSGDAAILIEGGPTSSTGIRVFMDDSLGVGMNITSTGTTGSGGLRVTMDNDGDGVVIIQRDGGINLRLQKDVPGLRGNINFDGTADPSAPFHRDLWMSVGSATERATIRVFDNEGGTGGASGVLEVWQSLNGMSESYASTVGDTNIPSMTGTPVTMESVTFSPNTDPATKLGIHRLFWRVEIADNDATGATIEFSITGPGGTLVTDSYTFPATVNTSKYFTGWLDVNPANGNTFTMTVRQLISSGLDADYKDPRMWILGTFQNGVPN